MTGQEKTPKKHKRSFRKFLQRYLKYFGASLAGTATETLVLWLLSDFVFDSGWAGEYFISPIIAFQTAVIVNFVVFYFYVWKDRRPSSHKRRFFFKRYVAFNVSCSSVYILRYALIVIIERSFGLDVVICNLIAMSLSGIANYILTNSLVFRKKDTRSGKA